MYARRLKALSASLLWCTLAFGATPFPDPAYQLLIGVPAHAAVGETVEVVDARTRGFVNGVLRALARKGPPFPLPEGRDIESLALRTSHPDWIARSFVELFGLDDAIAILELDNTPPPVTLRWRRSVSPSPKAWDCWRSLRPSRR